MLLVATGGTTGWRTATRELRDSLRRAGLEVALAEAPRPPEVRTFMLTDLLQARAARRAAVEGIARHRPAALVYCSMTAALLWPRPGAIWLDGLAASNRPGRHGLWQRVVERRRLLQAPLILEWAERALEGAEDLNPPSVVVPPPVEPSGSLPGLEPSGSLPGRDSCGSLPARDPCGSRAERDVAAVAYAADPEKRRVAFMLEVWARARRPGETLHVAGTESLPAGAPVAGVQLAGRLAREEYRALLRRSRVFLATPRREEFGLAPLEALADGCMLVTTPAPGAYPALDLARRLDPRLVADDPAAAIRAALDTPAAGYAERAVRLLEPFRRSSVDAVVASEVVPRLLKTRP